MSHRGDLEDLRDCVDNCNCICTDPPEDRDPPEDYYDYGAHARYCWQYLHGYIGELLDRLQAAPDPADPIEDPEDPDGFRMSDTDMGGVAPR